jgi:hypothetical protein
MGLGGISELVPPSLLRAQTKAVGQLGSVREVQQAGVHVVDRPCHLQVVG